MVIWRGREINTWTCFPRYCCTSRSTDLKAGFVGSISAGLEETLAVAVSITKPGERRVKMTSSKVILCLEASSAAPTV